MRAGKIVKAILEREHISTIEGSKAMGKNKSYLSVIVGRESIPKADTLAAICEAVGYELIARNKEDGFEIPIDPPE